MSKTLPGGAGFGCGSYGPELFGAGSTKHHGC